MLDISTLNENQRRAVEWGKKPLLVLAGPGSGKTFVLTMRVARLIRESPNARFRVLGLTFTRTAANMMRERVEHLLGPEARRARLTTFHSFCIEVLRQHGSHLGLRPDFEILTQDADRFQVLDEAIRKANAPDMPGISDQSVAVMIDHLLRVGYDAGHDTPLPFSGFERDWIRPIYTAYMDTLLRNNHLELETLFVCCIRLFRDYPRIAKHYRIVYPYICVDEYQDTNRGQEQLLRTLCPDDGTNFFIVADDDQIIHQWKGASPERLWNLQRDYKMSVIRFPESYRCPPALIELANNLIRFNVERLPDKIQRTSAAARQNSPVVRVRWFPDQSKEMAWIAEDIRDRSFGPEECAVLARNTKLLRLAAGALRCAGLSPYLLNRKDEFESPLVRFVYSALRLMNAPQESDQIRSLCKAYFDLTGVDVRAEDAEAESGLYGGSLLRGFLDVAVASPVALVNSTPLLGALRDQLLERLRYQEFSEMVFDWSSEHRSRSSGTDANSDEEADEIRIWNDLMHKAREHFDDDPTLSQFLQELDLRPKTTPPKRGDIQCLTIQRTKGKEFQHVYLIGLVESQLPSSYVRQIYNSRELEEERRSCFVAITRARSSLTLTLADSYFGLKTKPSRFLREMGLNGETEGARP